MIYDLHRHDELWGGFDSLSEALAERDRLNHDGLYDDFVVTKRINGSEGMNQLQILNELQGMLAHLKHYQRINTTSPDDQLAAGAEYAYGHACRRIDKLLVKILAEGVEIDECGHDTTTGRSECAV